MTEILSIDNLNGFLEAFKAAPYVAIEVLLVFISVTVIPLIGLFLVGKYLYSRKKASNMKLLYWGVGLLIFAALVALAPYPQPLHG